MSLATDPAFSSSGGDALEGTLAETVPADRSWYSHYPTGVPHAIEIPDLRLPDAIEASVRTWPRREAFLFLGSRWTYEQFWAATGRVAGALFRDGFRAGDRLALYAPNCPVHPIAFFGALRLGVSVVQVSPLSIGEDLVHILNDTEPKGVVTLEILYPNLAKVAGRVSVPIHYVARLRELCSSWRRPFVNSVVRRRGYSTAFPTGPSVRPWRALLDGPSEFPKATGNPAEEVAVLQPTGGTTGVPKAAMLTHRNLLANALQCKAWFQEERPGESVVLAAIPITHIYGLTVALVYPLINGATIVLELRPDPPEMLRLIAKYRPTELPGVPALYRALADHPKVGRYDIRSIRICVSGSAPLPVEVARRFEAMTGGNLVEGYGLTEAGPVTHANPIAHGLRKAGSVGLPFPLTDQKIVDLETGTRTLPVGEPGELAVRGPQVMLGYFRHPEESQLVLRDGWLRTGDVALIDDDGYAFIVDRKKDMIDVGGLKVYPREVEEVLYMCPGVAEATAIGVPDAALGEVVKAFVVPKPGASLVEADVIAFVRERIAHYKAPRSVEVRTSLPKSPIQKVLRRALRAEPAAPPPPTA